MNEKEPSDMASPFVRLRHYHLGNIKIAKIITPLLILGIVYVIYRAVKPNPSKFGIVRHREPDVDHPLSPSEINRHIGHMEDTRPAYCQDATYGTLTNDFYKKVTIILDYKDEQFYNLKLTLTSIFMFTPNHQYSEVIVIDDGTKKKEIIKHAAQFFKDPKFHNVKVYRSEESEGQSASRYKAARFASGQTLVFLSSDVVVNQGWLQPLLAKIKEDPQMIAVPHHDNFLPEYRFYGLDNGLINVMTWPLTTVYMETSIGFGATSTLDTPVMRGEAFAVNNQFFHMIGAYDENLDSGGGHNLELSLRTWLCGGKIQIILCSRVAVHSTLRPQEVTSHDNLRHITEMWLGDYKDIVYKQSQASSQPSTENIHKLQARKSHMKTALKGCNSFDWYLNNVAKELLVPSEDVQFFGKIKVQTNFCIKRESEKSYMVEMELCRPHIYDKAFLFEMDKNGFIKMGDLCLTVGDGNRVVLEQCRHYFEKGKQQWKLGEDGRLTSLGVPGKCASHFSERDKYQDLRHRVVMLECDSRSHRTQTWAIISY